MIRLYHTLSCSHPGQDDRAPPWLRVATLNPARRQQSAEDGDREGAALLFPPIRSTFLLLSPCSTYLAVYSVYSPTTCTILNPSRSLPSCPSRPTPSPHPTPSPPPPPHLPSHPSPPPYHPPSPPSSFPFPRLLCSIRPGKRGRVRGAKRKEMEKRLGSERGEAQCGAFTVTVEQQPAAAAEQGEKDELWFV